jgi:hypothetical protein
MIAAAVLLAAVAAGSPPAAAAPTSGGCPITLTDVAKKSGIEFRHERGATPQRRLPETMGSGVAWLDYDNDGWMDLYVVQSGPFPPNGSAAAGDRLYHNNHDGTFTDVTQKAGLHDTAYGMGAAAADYDNDGFTDLYVTNFGGNILYRNNGDGTFTDVTARAGVAASGWSTSAAWADVDGDGFLDLFVARYVDYSVEKDYFCGNVAAGVRDYCHPSVYPPTSGVLFRNNGNGTFTDITKESGVGLPGKELAVGFLDFDLDGKPDLFVANDTVGNFLFHNLGHGKFEDVSLTSGTAFGLEGKPQGGMGVGAGDFDGDGLPDLVVTYFDFELNGYYRNLGGGVFEDLTVPSGFGPPSLNFLAFGIGVLDLDDRGVLDAYIANGHLQDPTRRENTTYAERDFLMWNDGHGHFHEKGCGPAFDQAFVGRGVAVADYDNDGDPDVAVSNSGGPLQLLRNDGTHGHWAGIVLVGTRSNRQGIGARLTAELPDGRKLVRWVQSGDSYLSSSDPRVLFGLGAETSIRSLTIDWPSGLVQRAGPVAAGQYTKITEPR